MICLLKKITKLLLFLMKIKTSSLAPIEAVSFLVAFSATKKIQADSGTGLVLKTDFSASKKKTPAFRLVFVYF